MLTSAMRGETLIPNPNECNSTLTSGTNNIYPFPYIDVNDRGHHFRSGSPLTNYPHSSPTNMTLSERLLMASKSLWFGFPFGQ